MKIVSASLLLLLLWQLKCVRCIKPPRLNITDPFAVYMTDDNFTVTCEGTERLKWKWPSDLTTDSEYLMIEKSFDQGREYPHVSTLKIVYPERVDTGYYHCYYDDTTDMSDELRVTKSYVYFHDGQYGLVSDSKFVPMMVKTNEELVLDCRTTLPNITVKLTKNEEEVFDAEWDPRSGFKLNNLAVQDSGSYKCTSELNDFIMFFVEVSVASELPEPTFDVATHEHFVQGHNFTLQCHLMSAVEVNFTWTLPNPQANYKVTKFFEKRGNNNYEGSILHVYRATEKESGAYTCNASAPRYSPSSASIVIDVKESQDPYINITSVPSVMLNEGEPLNWKAVVKSFPQNPKITYIDGYGHQINETGRIRMKYDAKKYESWLYINNTTIDDFGVYTIEVSVNNGSIIESMDFNLFIFGKPYAKLKGMPSFVLENQTLEVSCLSAGFPLPNIKWTFRECPNGILDCSNDYKVIVPTKSSNTTLVPGNIKNTTISFVPPTSGVLGCFASNRYGTENITHDVSISDMGGNLIFRYEGQNKSVDLRNVNQPFDIIEHNDFYVLCGGTKFYYNKVTLTSPDEDAVVEDSKHSHTSVIQNNSVSSRMEGKYTCTAQPHGDSEPEIYEIMFRVLKEEGVAFTDSANLKAEGTEVEVKESEPFWLNCTVSGLPRPVIRWYKDETLLTEDNPIFDETTTMSEDRQRISFTYIFRDTHVGTYSCEAENRLGKLKGSVTVSVQGPGLSNMIKIVIGVTAVGIVLLVVIIFVLIRRVKRERKFRKSFRANELYLFEKGNIGQLNPDCTADEQAELLPYNQEWEINRVNIVLGRQLGSGAFGRVVKGIVKKLEGEDSSTVVAVKMCKTHSDKTQAQALSRELKIMIHLGRHLNIVNLIGANTIYVGKGELWILVEFCRYGNLLTFMHRHRRDFINQINPYTGQIDTLKTVQDVTSPTALSMQNLRMGYRPGPVTDMNGYLAPFSSNGNSLPNNNQSNSTGSSDGSYRAELQQRQFVGNPSYRMGFNQSVNPVPIGEVPVIRDRVTNRTSRDSHVSHPLNSRGSNAASDHSSWAEGLPTVNTDMTLLPPMSQRLSSFSSADMGLDSQGNSSPFDIGPTPGVNAPFTTSDLVCWGWQVAQGMDYLSRRKVLHGDLAARNLLLSDNNVVKISDFGLSSDMYKKDVYMKKGDDLMPIKWMSVEAIRDRIFSVQSDVWAYGVTLWELFTLGSVPYPALEANKEFLTFLEEGKRMDQPKYANKEIYDILLACWESDPLNRPTFSRIAEKLGFLMLPDIRGQFMTMNDPYMRMNEEHFRNAPDYLNMLSSPDFDHLNQKDGVGHSYANVPDGSDGLKDLGYLTMNSDTVGYSKVAMNQPSTVVDGTPPNYLPMGGVSKSRTCLYQA